VPPFFFLCLTALSSPGEARRGPLHSSPLPLVQAGSPEHPRSRRSPSSTCRQGPCIDEPLQSTSGAAVTSKSTAMSPFSSLTLKLTLASFLPVGHWQAPPPLLRRRGGATPVSPVAGYLARRLPRATPVLEPLPILHLTVRPDAAGRAALGLPRAVTTHACARLRAVAQAAWTSFGRGPCPRRSASGRNLPNPVHQFSILNSFIYSRKSFLTSKICINL
jgi:hypothetical protein